MANTPVIANHATGTKLFRTLKQEFGYGNMMQVPRIDKIVVNIGVGEAIG